MQGRMWKENWKIFIRQPALVRLASPVVSLTSGFGTLPDNFRYEKVQATKKPRNQTELSSFL